MEIVGYLSALAIGLVLGLLGGGGSILAIPILVYLFDTEPVRASAYSLFIVGITSAVGTFSKYREGLVSLRAGIAFGIPSILTIFITRKWVVPAIPDTVLQSGDLLITKRLLLLGLFAVLMILAAIPMIRAGKEPTPSDHPGGFLPMIAQGAGIGFITGLVGAGGGFLIIPGLVFLTGLPFKKAAGTSLLIIALNSLIGFMGDVLNYRMEWSFLLGITGLSIIGMVIGSRLSARYKSGQLRIAFGWFILITGLYILIKELN
ncbi:MAG: sulfite exporter TauE/SafE family protein [Cyclobacteriaceae bacterium]|nr:sulfite exporter TauE/SafE family protein [Cyclobacteriaceae bacterium]